jgi:hypothetical protein
MIRQRRPVEEWRSIGRELKELDSHITMVASFVDSRHGYSRFVDRINGLSKQLTGIRQSFDAQVRREYLNIDSVHPGIFF